MSRMTNKELIDYCTGVESALCGRRCPYEDKECDAYFDKYKSVPFYEAKFHPERYTDEVIILEGSEEE